MTITIFTREFGARLRAAWAVLRAKRVVVLTYDPIQPAHVLGELHISNCHPSELAERLANACLVAHEWDKIDSYEGQYDALRAAREILKLQPWQQ